jgi:DNA-binding transcriptional ArsR family regulator
MAMPPIVVVADLFARKGDEADRVRSEQSLLLLMEAMCAIDLLHLRQRHYAKLYESGIVYRREDGTENWLDIPGVIKAGWGDCEDLVFWRVAELRKDGVKAAPFAKWRRVNGVYKYHALVRRYAPGRDHFGRMINSNEWLEDPSRRLGMNGPSDDGRGIHTDYVHPERRAA